VANVADGSLASQFGLRAGDEIVAIAGERVFSIFEIQPRLSAAAAGTTTIIQFVRYGQVMQISVPGGQKLGAPLTAQTRAPLD
jgi:S1-C subfamily serine protease